MAPSKRIVLDPAVVLGKPVIRGTRLPVTLVVGSLAGGMSFEEVQQEYDLTADDIRAALGVIESAHEAGRPVAVHCAAGLGRTGTVMAAWLVTQGLDADAAIARIRELRPGSIETDEQEEAVRDFARSLSDGL